MKIWFVFSEFGDIVVKDGQKIWNISIGYFKFYYTNICGVVNENLSMDKLMFNTHSYNINKLNIKNRNACTSEPFK